MDISLWNCGETCCKVHKTVSHRKRTEVRIFMRPGWKYQSRKNEKWNKVSVIVNRMEKAWPFRLRFVSLRFLWMLRQFHRQDLSLLLQWFIDWHFALPPNKHTPLTFSFRSDTEPTLSIIWDVLVCPQGSVYGVQYNRNTRMRERHTDRVTDNPTEKTSLNQTKVVCWT